MDETEPTGHLFTSSRFARLKRDFPQENMATISGLYGAARARALATDCVPTVRAQTREAIPWIVILRHPTTRVAACVELANEPPLLSS